MPAGGPVAGMAHDGATARLTLGRDDAEFVRLWLVALATYGVGDVLTTLVLLEGSSQVNELNALLQSVVGAYGAAGLVAVKVTAYVVAIAVSVYGDRVDDPVLYYLPPAFLAVVGAFAAAFNLRLLLG